MNELVAEIYSKKDTKFSEEIVETIYFGGGTPSLLSKEQIEVILKAIEIVFSVQAREITIELNPDDVSKDYLQGLYDLGVNRVSMGVQTFNADLLKFMNRAHSAEEALKCLEILQKSPIEVFSVDLIYGNPNQTLDELERDLETLLDFSPPHVSAYSLTIEPRTRLGKMVDLGRIIEPEDETVAHHFDLVASKLKKSGLHRYEVSNFSKPGFEAKHNSSYWTHQNYLGLGPGVHSLWWEDEKSANRWQNEPNLKNYLLGGWKTPDNLEQLSLTDLAEERLMIALRTEKGISEQELENKYGYVFSEAQRQYLKSQEVQGNIKKGEVLKFSNTGLRIADALVLDLITKR